MERDIQRRLGNEYVVSVSPYLPDVMAGPDYMVGGNEQLFVPKYRESKSLE
jgi:allophanate hydrolase subunit 1